jgi:glycosyltransferase involved in cell wall biosynthesis
MTLSIIIPTYNRAPVLRLLLEDLLAQTRPPDEILVIDDHSADETRAVVENAAHRDPRVRYVLNEGRYQRDAKWTGVQQAHGDVIGFLDDDARMDDRSLLERLRPHIRSDTVIQAKVVLENMGRRAEDAERFIDRFTGRPWPVLELFPPAYHRGRRPRPIFPLIEFGNFWPRHLAPAFHAPALIADGYGESYAWSLNLRRRGVRLLFVPDLVIRHPGFGSGGSQRFGKTRLTRNFTPFHEGYFFNMVALHAQYVPLWALLWLPFYGGKILVALACNGNVQGAWRYGILPTFRALSGHLFRHGTS